MTGIKLIRGQPHLYRSVREGNRVRSVFVASGPAALALAERDAAIKAKSKADRAADEAIEAGLIEWFSTVERAVCLALEAAGYRRHKRGEWRRNRMVKRAELATIGAEQLPVRAEACRALDRNPEQARVGGGLAGHVIDATLKAAGMTDPLLAEATRRRVDQVRRDLAGPDPSPAEAILAQRAAVCWLTVYLADWAVASAGEAPIRNLDHLQRRADAANRRFLASMRTLAVVRKLAVPGLQVNIDARSVRLGSSPVEGGDDPAGLPDTPQYAPRLDGQAGVDDGRAG